MPFALGWGGTATTHIPCRSASHDTAELSRPSTSQYKTITIITRARGGRSAGSVFCYYQTPVWVCIFLRSHMPCHRVSGTVPLPVRFPPPLFPPWEGFRPGIGLRAGLGAGHRRGSACACARPPRPVANFRARTCIHNHTPGGLNQVRVPSISIGSSSIGIITASTSHSSSTGSSIGINVAARHAVASSE